MQSPTISSFQTQHFPLEPSPNAPRDVKTLVSTEHTIPAIPALNPGHGGARKKQVPPLVWIAWKPSDDRYARRLRAVLAGGASSETLLVRKFEQAFVPYWIFLWREE